MSVPARLVSLLAAASLTACLRQPAPMGAYVRAQPAADPPPTPGPVVLRVPDSPPAFGGQLKPLPGHSPMTAPAVAGPKAIKAAAVQQVVTDANHKAAQAPESADYFNAIVQYSYEPGTLYQVYCAPMRITDIALEPGEKILGQPASGDVVRWILALSKSMQHGVEQWHVYLKPTRPELETNLALNTDRRSYLLELHSYADTWMAAVEWHYPEDEIARLQSQADELATEQRNSAPVASLDALNFHYTIQIVKGSPAWTPEQVFDDGRKTFIRFPAAMLVREAPALFVLRDKETQLVNYRVRNDLYVVDRLVDSAELRVGQEDQEIVRIARTSARSPAPETQRTPHAEGR